MKVPEEVLPETVELLQALQRDWVRMGEEDPIRWTIGKSESDLDQYFESGRQEIDSVLGQASQCGLKVASGKALDFGCGIGRLTQALGRIYNEVHGLDISPSMIARAKALNSHPDKCHFHVHCDRRLNLFEPDYFDLIVAINVLPYIPEVLAKEYVREFIRVLKPGGFACFQMARGAFPRPLFPGAMLKLYRSWKHRRNPLLFRADRFHITEKTVRAILAEIGAKVLCVESGRAPTLWIMYRVLATKRGQPINAPGIS